MAEWIAFLLVCAVAAFASVGAVVMLIIGAVWSDGNRHWLVTAWAAALAVALICVAVEIAPFTVQAGSR